MLKTVDIFEGILNELQGVSFDARVWEPIIMQYLRLSKNKKEFNLVGSEYPKQFRSFPVDEFIVTRDEQYGNGGAYDETKSGYDQMVNMLSILFLAPGLKLPQFIMNSDTRMRIL